MGLAPKPVYSAKTAIVNFVELMEFAQNAKMIGTYLVATASPAML